MKVFLSWSGKASHDVATALRKWLPYMHHTVRPFISSDDIPKGERWNGALNRELEDAQYGIICVTPYNAHKPWMHFEAGALAHFLGRSRVMPLLFHVDRAMLNDGPLAQFQTTETTENDFYSLINALNNALPPEAQLDHEVLRVNFRYWWVQLANDLAAIDLNLPTETRTPYKWLRTFEDLAIQNPATVEGCKQIWFVTADPFKYAVRDDAQAMMVKNFAQTRYRFLVRKPTMSEEMRWIRSLDRLRKDHPKQFDYRCYDRETFEKYAASDYVIVESELCKRLPLKVYVRIPVDDNSTDYWFDTDERAAKNFFDRFSDLWDHHQGSQLADGTPEHLVIAATADAGSGEGEQSRSATRQTSTVVHQASVVQAEHAVSQSGSTTISPATSCSVAYPDGANVVDRLGHINGQ